MLTEAEREHLFMLGLGRPPERHYERSAEVTPRLQRVLDALVPSPAIVKTAMWDVVAWNAAAARVLTDYGKLPPERRNILRLMFSDAQIQEAQEDWLAVARYVVGAFRADAARAGAGSEIGRLVEELSTSSPQFAALWRDNDVTAHADGVKRLNHRELGMLELEFSTFAVDGRPDLQMIVYNPASPETAQIVKTLMADLDAGKTATQGS